MRTAWIPNLRDIPTPKPAEHCPLVTSAPVPMGCPSRKRFRLKVYCHLLTVGYHPHRPQSPHAMWVASTCYGLKTLTHPPQYKEMTIDVLDVNEHQVISSRRNPGKTAR